MAVPDEDLFQVMPSGVPLVRCPSSQGGDGVIPGYDVSNLSRYTITIEEDRGDVDKEKTSERIVLTLDGPNDAALKEATERVSKQVPAGLDSAADRTMRVYREAARIKATRESLSLPAAIPQSVTSVVTPAITTTLLPEPATQKATMSPAPAMVLVEYLLSDGATVVVGYDDVVIDRNTLALATSIDQTARMGMYTPPKTTDEKEHKIRLRIPGVDDTIAAYMLQDPFVMGGRRYLVMLIERE